MGYANNYLIITSRDFVLIMDVFLIPINSSFAEWRKAMHDDINPLQKKKKDCYEYFMWRLKLIPN